VWAAYGYGVLVISLVVVVRGIWRTPNLYRMQAVLITLAVGLPMISNFAQFSGLIPDYIDLTPVVFMAAGILMLIAAQRFEFLRLVPVAYDTIYNNISSGIVIVNPDGRIVRMNPAAESILGTAQSTTVGQSLQMMFPDHHDSILRTTREQPTTIELQLGSPVRVYELQANTLYNRRVLMGFIIMLVDITERKIALEEHSRLLLEEERTRILTTFIAKAAHEFRTPLSIIKSGQYLIGRTSDSEKVKALVARNDEQVDAITHLVDNALLLTRVDNPHAPLTLQKLEWTHCVGMVVERERASAAARGITLRYESGETKSTVLVDEEMISSALCELLNNAIRYSPNDSTVRIVCTTPACTVKFIDQGAGIAQNNQTRIFEPFYRVDTSHNTRGFGLGLPIARAVAERHNGRVELESSSEKGSVFSLWIPPASP
jgi:PAS domain S-box-containing protein